MEAAPSHAVPTAPGRSGSATFNPATTTSKLPISPPPHTAGVSSVPITPGEPRRHRRGQGPEGTVPGGKTTGEGTGPENRWVQGHGCPRR